MAPGDFLILCEKMKALGVQGFKFEGAEVAFYPPEPAWVDGTKAESTTTRNPLDDHDSGTPEGRRAIVRAQLEEQAKDLYSSAG